MKTDRAALRREVWRLALPAAGEHMVRFGSGIVDTFLMGHLGATALAVLGLSNQLILFGTVFMTPVMVGAGILVAQAFGAANLERAHLILAQAIWTSATIGIAFALVAGVFAGQALGLLGAEPGVVTIGTGFFRLFLITIPIQFFVFVVNNCLRGAGDTRTPLLIIAVETLFRGLAAYLLVNGLPGYPGLGATGVAIGAIIGQLIGAVLLLAALSSTRLPLSLYRIPVRVDLQLTRVILKLGIPSGGEQLGLRLGQIVNVRIIASLGTVGFAAYWVGFNSISLALTVGVGFAVAATTLVGQRIGAGMPLAAREGARQTWILTAVVLGVLGLALYFGAERIIAFFTNDPGVIELAVLPLRLVALFMPAEATNQILSGAFRGAGDTRWPFWVTTGGNFVVRIPLTLLLIGAYGLLGVWIALIAEISIRALINAWRFSRLNWETTFEPVSTGAAG